MDDNDVVLARQSDYTLKKIQLDTLRCWVRRKAKNHHFWLGNGLTDGFLKLDKKVHARNQWHRAHLRTSNHSTINMNWVTGVGHQHHIALIQGGQH